MLGISILHDQVTAFLHGQSKLFFFPKNDIQRTNILHPSNPKTPSKGKCYLLTSYNVNDFIERAPHDDTGNVTLMAEVAKQDFILHFATKLMLQSQFPVNNKVQTKHPFEYPMKTDMNSEIM